MPAVNSNIIWEMFLRGKFNSELSSSFPEMLHENCTVRDEPSFVHRHLPFSCLRERIPIWHELKCQSFCEFSHANTSVISKKKLFVVTLTAVRQNAAVGFSRTVYCLKARTSLGLPASDTLDASTDDEAGSRGSPAFQRVELAGLCYVSALIQRLLFPVTPIR